MKTPVGTGIFWNFTKPFGFLLEFTDIQVMYNIREYIDLISSINVIVDKTELKNSTVLCILILYVVYCDKKFHDFPI